jgi:hypothetical protein
MPKPLKNLTNDVPGGDPLCADDLPGIPELPNMPPMPPEEEEIPSLPPPPASIEIEGDDDTAPIPNSDTPSPTPKREVQYLDSIEDVIAGFEKIIRAELPMLLRSLKKLKTGLKETPRERELAAELASIRAKIKDLV